MEGSKQEIKCPECGQRLNVPEGYTDFAGCPTCMNKIEVYKGRVQKSKPEAVLSIWLNHAGSIRLFFYYIGTMVGLSAMGVAGSNYSFLYFFATVAYLVLACLVFIFEAGVNRLVDRLID